jgi:hypothetical protein
MWTVKKMDLHCALSYDTLHFDDNGLWEDHYFKVFKSIIQPQKHISRIDNWQGVTCHIIPVNAENFHPGSITCHDGRG